MCNATHQTIKLPPLHVLLSASNHLWEEGKTDYVHREEILSWPCFMTYHNHLTILITMAYLMMSWLLPQKYCPLLALFLNRMKFWVSHVEKFSVSKQSWLRSILGPFFYLVFNSDIPTSKITVLGTFADEILIIAKGAFHLKYIGTN